jgi:two-component system nitrogen regulation response regulator GlnG
MAPDILLVHKDEELLALFHKEVSKNTTAISSASLKSHSRNGHALIIIDTKGDWDREIKTLEKLRGETQEFYAIIASTPLLKKTMRPIRETALILHSKPTLHRDGSFEKNNGHEPNLAELVEKKLADFVGKIKKCEVKNLYSLLIQEFEKPLITLALKETNGNQIQAALLLGMNRNTLRKKIKELKISVTKKK